MDVVKNGGIMNLRKRRSLRDKGKYSGMNGGKNGSIVDVCKNNSSMDFGKNSGILWMLTRITVA